MPSFDKSKSLQNATPEQMKTPAVFALENFDVEFTNPCEAGDDTELTDEEFVGFEGLDSAKTMRHHQFQPSMKYARFSVMVEGPDLAKDFQHHILSNILRLILRNTSAAKPANNQRVVDVTKSQPSRFVGVLLELTNEPSLQNWTRKCILVQDFENL